METCSKCRTLGHYKNFCKGGTREQRAKSKDKGKVTAVTADAPTPAATSTDAGDQSGSVGALAGGPTGSWMKISGSVESGHLGVLGNADTKLPHKECSPGGAWRTCNVEPHGRLELSLRVCKPAYDQLNLRVPPGSRAVRVAAMADTGAGAV